MILKCVSRTFKRSIMTTIDPYCIVPATKGKNTGTVIFLHGSGGTGSLSKEWVEMLKPQIAFPHLKILFPTAPLRPYTPLMGELSNVWFNRIKISPDSPEHLETLSQAAEDLKRIVQQEIDSGIPADRIIIGGFSMGGAMSLHMGYRITPQIGGVFALSSFLNENSLVYQELQQKKSQKLPPLFYTQGDRDDLVLFNWAENTFKQLQSYGVQGQFVTKKGAFHELKKKEIDDVWKWIAEIVPDQ
ncbi:lysophospholipase-like protein 1 isoform X4 [Planococcus citri]|uniref:lysophospholipase-like protein 1 isoform X4 n=1 Tax=Planococcus citri TaxID=170843 RepID=UPI0031F932B7